MEVQIEPNAREYKALLALLWAENDSLRERIGGAAVSFGKRVFSTEDLARGRSLGLKACVRTSGAIVVTLDS